MRSAMPSPSIASLMHAGHERGERLFKLLPCDGLRATPAVEVLYRFAGESDRVCNAGEAVRARKRYIEPLLAQRWRARSGGAARLPLSTDET